MNEIPVAIKIKGISVANAVGIEAMKITKEIPNITHTLVHTLYPFGRCKIFSCVLLTLLNTISDTASNSSVGTSIL